MEYQKGEVANELEILDKVDRLVQPYYAHLFRGDPYPLLATTTASQESATLA